jgi:hypothetical protein
MGPNYVPGEKKDLTVKSVQRTVLCMGRKQEAVESGEGTRQGLLRQPHTVVAGGTMHYVDAMQFFSGVGVCDTWAPASRLGDWLWGWMDAWSALWRPDG